MFFRKKKSGEADSQKEERAAGSNSNFDRSKTYATISLTEPIASSQFILPAHTTTSQQQTNNYWTNSSSDVLGLSTTSLTNYSDESVDFLRFNGGNTVLQQQKTPSSSSNNSKNNKGRNSSLSNNKGDAGTTPDGEVKLKYACPTCNEPFVKWSQCLSHLRERSHFDANALDKKLNPDLRKVQERCAIYFKQVVGPMLSEGGRVEAKMDASKAMLAYHQKGPLNNSFNSSSNFSSSNVSSSTLVSEEEKAKRLENKFRKEAALQKLKQIDLRKRDLVSLPESVTFKINSFLDVDSAANLFKAVSIKLFSKGSNRTKSSLDKWGKPGEKKAIV